MKSREEILKYTRLVLDQAKNLMPPHVKDSEYMAAMDMWSTANAEKMQRGRGVNAPSFKVALQRAIMDGLIPDGRECLLAIYWKRDWDQYESNYQVGVHGLVKLGLNTGQIKSVNSNVVRENDDFDWIQGDDESITHKPEWKGDRGKPVLTYAILSFVDGQVKREVIFEDELKKIAEMGGKSWSGPFSDEMRKKSTIKRAFKYVQLDANVEGALRRYESDFEYNPAADPSGFEPSPASPATEDESQDPADQGKPAESPEDGGTARLERLEGERHPGAKDDKEAAAFAAQQKAAAARSNGTRAKAKMKAAAQKPAEQAPEPAQEEGPSGDEPPPIGDDELPI